MTPRPLTYLTIQLASHTNLTTYNVYFNRYLFLKFKRSEGFEVTKQVENNINKREKKILVDSVII